jgi:hypothetical protein
MKAVSLRAALADDQLLGQALPGESWFAWRTLLIASMGEGLVSDEERAVFLKLTGRSEPPPQQVDEAWFVIGRRGGKDQAASALSSYLATCVDYSGKIAPGERPAVVCIGAGQQQSRIQKDRVAGTLRTSPLLSRMIANETSDTIELDNGVSIEVRAASYRRLRGVTACGIVATEVAYWMDDEVSANPDSEILNAVRPSLATTGGPLVVITSPYARKGETWNTFRRHFGPEGDPLILVAKGPTWELNSTLPRRVFDRAYERDEAAASAEYGSDFRRDLEAFVSRESVEQCIEPGVYEVPPNYKKYHAFADMSGGSVDSAALAIASRQHHRKVVLDFVRERRAPHDPLEVAEEFARDLHRYGLHEVEMDRYAGTWPIEAFMRHGIRCKHASKVKSDLYKELLPMLNSREVELLDSPRLVSQLIGLERRVARGGRDSIDHAPNGHDDVANAAAGALVAAKGTALGRMTTHAVLGGY